jgi:cadmium resistance protein CadD (predicted permease)
MLGFLGFFPIILGIKGFVELIIEFYKRSSININEIVANDDVYAIELEAIRYRNDIDGQIIFEIRNQREQQDSSVDSSSPSSPTFKQKVVKLLSHCFNLQILKVASVTLANSGDNVAIYTPLFAQASGWQIGVYAIIFLLMVFVWLIVSYLFINFRPVLNLAQKYAHLIVPFVFIGLGIYIIVTSECFPWLAKAIQTKNFKDG